VFSCQRKYIATIIWIPSLAKSSQIPKHNERETVQPKCLLIFSVHPTHDKISNGHLWMHI